MRIRFTELAGVVGSAQNLGHGPLCGAEMASLPVVHDAFVDLVGGRIAALGPMADCPNDDAGWEVRRCPGQWMLPGFVDSHTHLVYAAPRVTEFRMRLDGASYHDIAAAGGGILNSAAAIAAAEESALLEALLARLETARSTGTVAAEIKSGYGLTLEAERKMLRVVQRARELQPMPLWATFLALHALPKAANLDDFVATAVDRWLPALADDGLVDFVDVFCEANYFRPSDLVRLAEAAAKRGIPLKAHVNQFQSIGGIQASVAAGARSVDHLEVLTDADLQDLQTAWAHGDGPMPVALPHCSLFLNIPYTPGRALIDAGLPLAIASDCNPGSAPSSDLRMAWSLAAHQMKLRVNEGLAALTANAAYAVGAEGRMGRIQPGMDAHLILTQPMADYAELPYFTSENRIAQTLIYGR
ncbi:MAG: imidazolonepropionase [Bacteroidota bacterium]